MANNTLDYSSGKHVKLHVWSICTLAASFTLAIPAVVTLLLDPAMWYWPHSMQKLVEMDEAAALVALGGLLAGALAIVARQRVLGALACSINSFAMIAVLLHGRHVY